MVTGPGWPHPDDDPDDVPVDAATAHLDVRFAQRAVVVHGPEVWPGGAVCRNCHAAWPCRVCRWGVAVLHAVGWTDEEIVALVDRARNGDVPW